jgi:hypothetical protein
MKRIVLIYKTGCQKYKTIKQVLLDIGLPFEEVNQAQLHKGCVCRTFTSPTILVDDDVIIFGGPRKSELKKESSELAYLKNIPNKKELRTLFEMAGIFSAQEA